MAQAAPPPPVPLSAQAPARTSNKNLRFLFVLGIGIYASLIKHVIRGPMLSQILSTFGLALLLRYTAFAHPRQLPQLLPPGDTLAVLRHQARG